MTTAQYVLIAIVAVGATARLTRLIAFDAYPPAAWLRIKWDNATGKSEWNTLLHCGYCLAPWIGAGILAWGYFTDYQTAWWLFCSWLSLAYAAAIVTAYDGDDD